jgi:hypothetical protein
LLIAALALLIGMLLMLAAPAPAHAAEVLQVRDGSLLQIGDRNRSYPVRLGCILVEAGDQAAATSWLRDHLPRRTRVNLRPLGSVDGVLHSRVKILSSGEDLGSGLVAAGLAAPLPRGLAPDACPQLPVTTGA